MRFPTFTLTALVLAGAAGAVTASDDLTIVSKNTLNGKPGATTTDATRAIRPIVEILM